jgi:nucleotide-binding universal stress UspA family protein
MTRVLIAVDETEDSMRAAESAHRLFGDDADYVAVSVADARLDPALMTWWGAGWGVTYPVPYGAVWPYRTGARSGGTENTETDLPSEEQLADAAADDARTVADESGLPDAEAIGEIGDPADAIVRAAEESRADVIVLGTRDRGWFDRLIHPSVSKHVARHTDIPVLVVP